MVGAGVHAPVSSNTRPLGEFILEWGSYESTLRDLQTTSNHRADQQRSTPGKNEENWLHEANLLSDQDLAELRSLKVLRNRIVHSPTDAKLDLGPDAVRRLRDITAKLRRGRETQP